MIKMVLNLFNCNFMSRYIRNEPTRCHVPEDGQFKVVTTKDHLSPVTVKRRKYVKTDIRPWSMLTQIFERLALGLFATTE
jgi:hypothetical protein